MKGGIVIGVHGERNRSPKIRGLVFGNRYREGAEDTCRPRWRADHGNNGTGTLARLSNGGSIGEAALQHFDTRIRCPGEAGISLDMFKGCRI